MAAHKDWEIDQGDIVTAFLLSNLDEEIYMEQPPGFVVAGKENYVCRLRKSIYGLKQSPKVWNCEIDSYLKSLGYCPNSEDTCIYSLFDSVGSLLSLICLYVDDLLFAGPRALVDEVKLKISSRFPFSDLGPARYVLGFEVQRNRNAKTLILHQHAFITNLLERTNMSLCHPAKTPSDPGISLSVSMCPQTDVAKRAVESIPYRQTTGALLYLAHGTRPEIAHAVSEVCKYNSNYGVQHWTAVKRILRYLKGTSNMGITLGGNENLEFELIGYSDSDWGRDVDTRRSTTGYIFLLGQGPVTWKSKLQSTPALSSMESEYMAICSASQEAIWLRKFLSSIGYVPSSPTTIFEDNQSTIKFIQNTRYSSRAKHIDIKHHFVRDAYSKRLIDPVYTHTSQNKSDIMTKPLSVGPFIVKRQDLGMDSIQS